MPHSTFPKAERSLRHPGFIEGIGAMRRYADFRQRQANRLRLQSKKLPADAMHADALKALRNGREEGCYLEIGVLAKGVESHRAVFPPAPGEHKRRRHSSVATSKLITKADTRLATERGITERQLVALVEEIASPGIDGNAAIEIVVAGEIKARIARVADVAEPQKIAVGGLTDEVAGERGVELAECTGKGDGAGIGRPPNQPVSGDESRVERVRRFYDQAVVVGVVARDEKPLGNAGLGRNVRAQSARQVRIEVGAVAERATSRRRDRARASWRAEREAHNVVEAVGIIVGGKFDAVVRKLLIDARAPGFAGFGLQGRITGITGIGSVGLIEALLLDALAVE